MDSYKDYFDIKDKKTISILQKHNISYTRSLDKEGNYTNDCALEFEITSSILHECEYEEKKNKIYPSLIREYNKLIGSEIVWTFCSVKTFIENYDKLLSSFLTTFPHANEFNFINSELEHRPYKIENIDWRINKEIEYNQKNIIQYLKNKKTNIQTQESTTIKNKEHNIWFKVGVHFAKGEIANLHLQQNKSFTETAKQLGNKNFRPYISESWNNTNRGDKNIFSYKDKINEIINYCNENNITISESFTTRVNAIQ